MPVDPSQITRQNDLLAKDLPTGSVELNTTDWAAGSYLYKLQANGETIDAKRMLISK